MSDLLKGNFKTKRQVVEKDSAPKSEAEALTEKLRQQALAKLGGSMVYVERKKLLWNGDEEKEKKES
jgi:hypothetical protein